ncbi:hypothetical protein PULV_a4044 [Pseudoalteromonas ulvae UL12]|nr:hypothetical protein [Pseudoalteromonas ulvae UL12]
MPTPPVRRMILIPYFSPIFTMANASYLLFIKIIIAQKKR